MFKKIGEWFVAKKDIIKAAVTSFWEGWCLGGGVIMLAAAICAAFSKHNEEM